jgi:hypothetical protein
VESREQKWRRQGSRPPKGFPLQPQEIRHEGDQLVSDQVTLSNKEAAKRTFLFFGGIGTVIGLLCWEPWIMAPIAGSAVVYFIFMQFKFPGER